MRPVGLIDVIHWLEGVFDRLGVRRSYGGAVAYNSARSSRGRSEEHTSELQSRQYLVTHSFPTRRSSDLVPRRPDACSMNRVEHATVPWSRASQRTNETGGAN